MTLHTIKRFLRAPMSVASCISMLVCLMLGSSYGSAFAQEVTGTDTIGPRSSHIFTLRIPGDPTNPNDFGDTLPPGSGILFQYGIFDTGSNTIGINNVATSDGTNTFLSTANILDLCGPGDADCGTPTGTPPRVPGLPILDMRVWGLSRISSTGAPLDTPEAEIFGIVVRPSPIVANLLGAPLGNSIVTHIDYSTVINNANVLVPGADITFFPPGDAGIPTPLYELQLARFGNTTPTIEGATRGSFYSLVDFAFTNNGDSAVTGDMLTLPDSSMRVARVFLDTGNTTTQITRPMAAALGIDPDVDPADATVIIGTAGGVTAMLNCYELSSVEFDGIGGAQKYVISSPLVCVSDAASFGTSTEPHDVILGTNYFEQTQILVNGPADKLGMYQGVASNNPPVANAGADQTVECDSMSGASIMLDGSGSSDPDSDTLTYSWTGPFGTVSGANPNVTLAVGVHTVTLTVDDGNGATDTDDTEITVVDTVLPIVDAGPDVVLEATSPDGAPYDVSFQVTASDSCGPVGLAISPAPPNYPFGSTVVTVTATDSSGNSAEDTVTVTVVDTTPPELSIAVTPTILWPPNHKMIPIEVTHTVFDIADANPSVEFALVQSDEGDGVDTFDPAFDFSETVGRKGGDMQLADGQLYVRAERAGNSDGRTYSITYRATDASGNSATAVATVVVPHNQ